MEDLENKVDGITMPAEDSQVSVENSNESSNEPETISFADLGLDEITLAAIEKKGFKVPSPIQVLAIPRLLNGDANVIARPALELEKPPLLDFLLFRICVKKATMSAQ